MGVVDARYLLALILRNTGMKYDSLNYDKSQDIAGNTKNVL